MTTEDGDDLGPSQILIDLVRATVKQSDLTQRVVARRSDISDGHICRIIAGDRAPRWHTFVTIIQACGKDVEIRVVDRES